MVWYSLTTLGSSNEPHFSVSLAITRVTDGCSPVYRDAKLGSLRHPALWHLYQMFFQITICLLGHNPFKSKGIFVYHHVVNYCFNLHHLITLFNCSRNVRLYCINKYCIPLFHICKSINIYTYIIFICRLHDTVIYIFGASFIFRAYSIFLQMVREWMP